MPGDERVRGIRRRDFITGLVGTAAWPVAAGAQQSSLPLVGFMSARSPEDSASVLQAFYKGLKEEGGYVDGESVRLEHRWARGTGGATGTRSRLTQTTIEGAG